MLDRMRLGALLSSCRCQPAYFREKTSIRQSPLGEIILRVWSRGNPVPPDSRKLQLSTTYPSRSRLLGALNPSELAF